MPKQISKPIALVILDGWANGSKDKTINAIAAAKTPFFDQLVKDYPSTQLGATGTDVGLEENQMSGSEAGHLNIGAGRVVKQDIRTILEDISKGAFFKNPAFLGMINRVKRTKSNIHLMGLMGNADSPHSHPDVFLALLILLKNHGFSDNVFVHLFTDGRDSFPQSALEHFSRWDKMMQEAGIGTVASVSGRFYAMDRAKNWDRLLQSYDVMVNGKGRAYKSVPEAIRDNYGQGNSDEYIQPGYIEKAGRPTALLQDNDAIIFFNSRSDRARQFSKLFVGTQPDKDPGFPKIQHLKNLSFIAMTNFGPDLKLETAYYSTPIINTLPVVMAARKQLYIAETEKYAHITYFINGGYAEAIDSEERILIPSPNVRSYAEQPQMSADKITQAVCKSLRQNRHDFFAINYANADMVGHTGDFRATVKAVEFLDQQLKKLYTEISKKDGIMIVTADHGNADIMLEKETGRAFTFHTKNPVPFVIASEDKKYQQLKLSENGILANIAPTLLTLADVYKPEEMTADSLIQ